VTVCAGYGVASISVVLQTRSTDPAVAVEGSEPGALPGGGVRLVEWCCRPGSKINALNDKMCVSVLSSFCIAETSNGKFNKQLRFFLNFKISGRGGHFGYSPRALPLL